MICPIMSRNVEVQELSKDGSVTEYRNVRFISRKLSKKMMNGKAKTNNNSFNRLGGVG